MDLLWLGLTVGNWSKCIAIWSSGGTISHLTPGVVNLLAVNRFLPLGLPSLCVKQEIAIRGKDCKVQNEHVCFIIDWLLKGNYIV